MHFHLPRRHRRRLLLPPGLLALAGLLLLGCLALRPWQERLKRRSVLELTMPRLVTRHDDLDDFMVFAPEKLTAFHEWYDTYFDGSRPGDTQRAQSIDCQAAAMQATPLRDQRFRVRLGPHATYTELIFLLNTMRRFDIKRYVLDTNHGSPTFYAFTVTPLARKSPPPLMPCGGTGYSSPIVSSLSSSHWLASYKARYGRLLAVLRNPEWRVPFIVLAFLFLLNVRRLLHLHVARTL